MDEKYMKIAIEEAFKAYKKNEIPVGAVIVKNGEIISKAYNRKESRQCVLEHAEISAIIKANRKIGNWRLNGCDMYVTLEPCPMCASAIKQARISRVFYLFGSTNVENSKIVNEIFRSNDSNRAVENIKIDLSFTAANFLSEFFNDRRNRTNVLDR